jgi:leader peptidase (prepilin peptidase)/N-methyltransferase
VWQSQTVILFFFFLFGMVIGSFLNVCIARIPEGLSIVSPSSRCPRCKTPIKAYDNVPVLGWLWLGAKCRKCRMPISPVYPLVELTTAVLFVCCYLKFGVTPATFKWLVFTCLVIVLTITDLRVRILPDAVNWSGFVAGLIFSAFVPIDDGAAYLVNTRVYHGFLPDRALGPLDAILGAAFGSLLLWGAAALYKLARGREGMGFGDVKMMAMVGAFLGVRGAFFTILFGTLLGSVIGIILIVAMYLMGWKRGVAERASRRGMGTINAMRWTIATQYQLPLGTFLGMAALLVVFFFSPATANLTL